MVAILEDDLVAEIFVERERQRGVVGNVYKGRVSKVLPGMQSSFIDLGLERDGFSTSPTSSTRSRSSTSLETDEDDDRRRRAGRRRAERRAGRRRAGAAAAAAIASARTAPSRRSKTC